MLTNWLPGDEGVPNTLPRKLPYLLKYCTLTFRFCRYTTHTAGVGAYVFNKEGEILVVKEKTGPAVNNIHDNSTTIILKCVTDILLEDY